MCRLLLPLLFTPCLFAQSPDVSGGLTVGLSFPTGDFATAKLGNGDYAGANNGLGAQLGGNLYLTFDRHHQLRFHATLNSFSSEEQDIYDNYGYAGTLQNNFNIFQIGGDYIYHFERPTRGGYILAGLSLNRIRAESDYTDYPDWSATQSGRAGFRIGGGYHFNRIFSLEGQYNCVSVNKDGSDGFGMSSISWISVNAVLHFSGR